MLQNTYRLPTSRQAARPVPALSMSPAAASVNPWQLWNPQVPAQQPVLSVAELSECRCPDLCNRDHVNE